jgi:sodium-dependent dicarboxylate transporter 2/3/5
VQRARRWALPGAPLLALILGAALLGAGLTSAEAVTAGVTLWCALWWVFEPVPIPATSIIPFAALPLGGVLTHQEVATAYGHHLILLLMGGLILSTAMETSGAHRRVALMMVRLVGGESGPRLVLGFMIAAASLSMWISNTATTLMLLPVALAVLQQTGQDRARLAPVLILGIAYAANIGGVGTPVGTPPNVIFMASYEQATGEPWSFLRWMSVGVPVILVFLPLMWRWLVRGLVLEAAVEVPHPGPWRPAERRVLWVTRAEPFGGWNAWVEALWGVDLPGRQTVTGDSTVALAMAVVMFLVRDGRGGRVLDWEHAVRIPWGLLLLFGGGLAIGKAFVASGLSGEIGALLRALTAWHVLPMIAALCLSVTFLTEVTSNTATTNILMPILAAGAIAAGIHPALLMVPAAISASCAFMLPVATAPNAIAFGTGEFDTARMIREGLALNLIGAAVVTLLTWILL